MFTFIRVGHEPEMYLEDYGIYYADTNEPFITNDYYNDEGYDMSIVPVFSINREGYAVELFDFAYDDILPSDKPKLIRAILEFVELKDELAEKYFYDSNYEETCKIGVAVSKNIEGPYVNITNEPMEYSPFDFEYLNIEEAASNTMELTDASLLSKVSKGSYIPAIDVNILFEENRMIMYFSRCCYKNCRYDEEYKRFIEASNVACVELDMAWWFDKEAKSMPKIADSFITYDEQGRRKDKFITLISYQNEPQGWENEHVNDYKTHNKMRKNRRWSEGSTIFKVEDRYCLTYNNQYYRLDIFDEPHGLMILETGLTNKKSKVKIKVFRQIKKKNTFDSFY